MIILSNGQSYVMENPFKYGEYLSTTSPNKAKEFTYKQARSLLQRGGKKLSWLKDYQMVDLESGAITNRNYKGNANVYVGSNDVDFNESILDDILKESESLLGLFGWDIQQLNGLRNLLETALSKYDSAVSDIHHALQKYREDNDGKNPQAHKMAKIGYLLNELRDKHKKIKQCISYIQVMQDAHKYKYDIVKTKLELSKAVHGEYKGRTEYYKIALDLLK